MGLVDHEEVEPFRYCYTVKDKQKMTLQKIKDKYAKEKGYPNWDDLSKEHRYRIVSYEKHMDNICILAQKQVLYNVAENAKAISSGYTESVWHCGCSYEVHKESILNESNLVL